MISKLIFWWNLSFLFITLTLKLLVYFFTLITFGNFFFLFQNNNKRKLKARLSYKMAYAFSTATTNYEIFNIRFQGAEVWNDTSDDIKLSSPTFLAPMVILGSLYSTLYILVTSKSLAKLLGMNNKVVVAVASSQPHSIMMVAAPRTFRVGLQRMKEGISTSLNCILKPCMILAKFP